MYVRPGVVKLCRVCLSAVCYPSCVVSVCCDVLSVYCLCAVGPYFSVWPSFFICCLCAVRFVSCRCIPSVRHFCALRPCVFCALSVHVYFVRCPSICYLCAVRLFVICALSIHVLSVLCLSSCVLYVRELYAYHPSVCCVCAMRT